MSRIITVEKDILEANDTVAARNRKRFEEANLLVLNLMGTPGAGKTSLLEATVRTLSERIAIGVIEGDIATDCDALRIESAGASWVRQINTGGACHLEAGMIEMALEGMPAGLKVLVIENVGNLVCPASFDLGEKIRVMLASLTEGADKPKKYPGMFRKSDTLIINKIDLAPHLEVEPGMFAREALAVNPALRVFQISATQGQGISDWCGYLESAIPRS